MGGAGPAMSGVPTGAMAPMGTSIVPDWSQPQQPQSLLAAETFTNGNVSKPGAVYRPPVAAQGVASTDIDPGWKEAAVAGVGTRSQVGPPRFVNGIWTTFPSNHPDAPDYNGQNPGDWEAWTNGYVPGGQKAQFSGKRTV